MTFPLAAKSTQSDIHTYILKISTPNQINPTSVTLSGLSIISMDLQKVSKTMVSLDDWHKICGRDDHIQ